jgi:hypothetical protein
MPNPTAEHVNHVKPLPVDYAPSRIRMPRP